MSVLKLERKREELLTRLKGIASDTADELTDTQRAESGEIRAQLDGVTTDLAHYQKIEELEKRSTDATAAPVAEYATARRKFSLRKAILSQLGNRGVDCGLENEVADEIRSQNPDRGFVGMPVPSEALETRATTTTLPAGNPGSNLTTDNWKADQYIPLLRNSLVVRNLGATILSGLRGDVKIPKANSGTSGGWASEQGALPETDLSFLTPVLLSPHKAGTVSEYSLQLLLQSSPDIDQLLRQDLAENLARVIDEACLFGSTGEAPKGICGKKPTAVSNGNKKSVTEALVEVTEFASGAEANGKKPNLADWIKLFKALDEKNVGAGSRSLLINSATKYSMLQEVVFPSTDSRTIFSNGMLLNQPVMVSNIARSDGALGTGTGLSTAIYGQWSDLILGYFQDLEIMANSLSDQAFRKGSVLVRALVVCDTAIRRSESFSYYNTLDV